MNKLKMKSVDLTQANIDKIAELFPNVITEARDEHGKIKRAVDFDLLKQELSDVLVEGEKERYQLTWPGKKQAILNANTPIEKTLRPVKEDSFDWDNTHNLYIEGDNLEVLKLLQESYLNKIKCIYIDPPYNTGKDFVYKDDFSMSGNEYQGESGQVDEAGNRLFQNTETNGRFHSDWLTMMYSRIKVAKNLLKDDGVIFISIDDNEVFNLRKICDEIFGSTNFIANVIWHKKYATANDAKYFAEMHDHILVYRKSDSFMRNLLPRTDKQNSLYKYDSNDGRGPWRPDNLSVKTYSAEYDYPIINPNTGKIYNPPKGRCWVTNKDTMEKWINEGRVFFGQKGDGAPQLKRYLNEVQDGVVPPTYWSYEECGHNDESRKEIKMLFEQPPFDTPKPTRLIRRILQLSTNANTDDIVLDFFSGSATTAHAVMQQNSEDSGNRRYIMVQLPEPTSENSEAYKAGYKNICEIGKERIRRAAKKIKEETGADIDYGFRVFRVDSSNMKDVYYTPDKLKQGELFDLASNIKEDRSGEDLLIQVMLELGLELSLPMETKQLEGKTVHYVAGNSLIACFEDNVPESVMKQIAAEQPLRVVFRDSSFEDDSARINVEELFKMLSPGTDIQVL
ncbi:site-specific DNA-methyltransferase [Paenibacillus macerans]|uniref:site-specific DNA-methyltransferase n=1 Tax=Paenibacillus macerans TaxID=44252 RepID=UPI0022E72D0B|nr:site-specific DNA-methyltransferase [Paenibacillus macerans]MEC0140926.1 site-specific DNA-methyltransferase [Paenibacillus macerans]